MLANLRIGTRLFILFNTVLLFIVLIGAASYWSMSRMQSHVSDLTSNRGALQDNSQLALAHINMMRRYEKDLFLNMGDPAKMAGYQKKWNDTLGKLNRLVDSSQKLVSAPGYPSAARDQECLAAMRRDIDAYATGFRKVAGRVAAGEIITPQDANKAIEEYKTATHDSEALSIRFADNMEKEMDATTQQAVSTSHRLKVSILLFSGAAAFIAWLLGYLAARSITVPLAKLVLVAQSIARGDLGCEVAVTSRDETGELTAAVQTMAQNLRRIIGEVADHAAQVAAAAAQMHGTAERIAGGAERVAVQTGAVASAGEEMSATSSEIASNSQLAAQGAHNAAEAAQAGAAVVENTVTVMAQIAAKVQESARTVESLGQRSDQIEAIIGTIEDIADQTNLLALNAAIEAARAGEQGRGFAVVADEVRALAERTTKATHETGEMIKAIQRETREAVDAMEQGVRQVEAGTSEASGSGGALREILQQVSSVALQVQQIAVAAEEQSATNEEIADRMQQITLVVQETSQGAQDSVTAAALLNRNAEELQQLVRQFRL
ncbi:methyl-accepting chemotaxis protein [Geomonas sp. Red69]|uniref:methyl-accepting chemotaxis protein n=1 Tax=Geomonas diazotrophica TaxID=2843197 RepID=UPI001C124916|nr:MULTISPECIES: methyl-accepting chemotaxis protein [Geomonas]MBU5635316.1 methyl-accepting chemotaxis protein [Geomonas diazotrophica]QXE86767.1 methyl-accepting chemotaxis protein [Geomonas nitrogeniifigens]